MRLLRFALLLAVVATATVLSSCGDSGEQPYPVHTYQMGERIVLGHIVYKVFETQWLTQIGQGPDARIPQHRFFLVRLSAVNSAGVNITVPNFSVVDDNGNTYPEQSNGEGVPQYIGFLRNVQPAESNDGNALFDAPPRHYKLKIFDETGDKTAFVDIPLSFASETPEIPEVGGKEKK